MFILLSELVFSLGFSQCFSLKGFFTSVFFPWWMLGHHPPKFVFVCGSSSSLCIVFLLSVLITFWSGVHSKRLILVIVHVWHAGMLLHAVSIVREHLRFPCDAACQELHEAVAFVKSETLS